MNLSPCSLSSQSLLIDQLPIKKRKTFDCETTVASLDEKIKKIVSFGTSSKCYFFQNAAPNEFAIKAKDVTKMSATFDTSPLRAFERNDLNRFDPSIIWILKHENLLFRPIKSLLQEPLPIAKKQQLLELMLLKLYLTLLVKETIKDMQNFNIIDSDEEEWIKAWVEAIVLNLTLQFNEQKKIQIALEWIGRLIPHNFLPELNEKLTLVAENIADLFMQASCKSQAMVHLQDLNPSQIPASNASCFWVRFLSSNPYCLSQVSALFSTHPEFLKNIRDEINCLVSNNAINLALEFQLNVQINASYEKFHDYCFMASSAEIHDFFNYCLKKDSILAHVFPFSLNFQEVLDAFDRIHSGPQGRFIAKLISSDHPLFQPLKERMHIDHAFSTLNDLDLIHSSSDFFESIKTSLLNFPYKKKQPFGPSVSFIDVDLLVESLAIKCVGNRSLQSLYFWRKLFTLYPHYKKRGSIKQIFINYVDRCEDALKKNLASLNIS